MSDRRIYPDELCHHGILGMKWGKRNGPPYPLDAKDHSASEKKAGWRKSLSSGSKKEIRNEYRKVKAQKKKRIEEYAKNMAKKAKLMLEDTVDPKKLLLSSGLGLV